MADLGGLEAVRWEGRIVVTEGRGLDVMNTKGEIRCRTRTSLKMSRKRR